MESHPISLPVIIIGAGASGLTTLKACLEEKLHVVCLEKTDNIGGLWHYREEVIDGLAAVMKSTILNTSKEMVSYSDFPAPIHFPPYMHHRHMDEYLNMYADHFNLRQHVRLRHQVQCIKKAKDYDKTGHWVVIVKQMGTGTEYECQASAVFVCSGMYGHPKWPEFKGLSDFNGRVLHVHSYRDAHGFEDKNVLVIGMGNSGGDVAVELSRTCRNVYWSTRRGSWVVPRLGNYGLPIDMQHLRRPIDWLSRNLPSALKNYFVERQANQRFDHQLFNVKPKHRFLSQRLLVNDECFTRLATGTLQLKSEVYQFTTDGVAFVDDPQTVHSIDGVILATGYDSVLPYIDDVVFGSKDSSQIATYRYVFPLALDRPTLAFIGQVIVSGPGLPVMELQARWAIQVLSRKCTLPSREVMTEEMTRRKRHLASTLLPALANSPSVNDYVSYMDDLAKCIGVKPDLTRLALVDWPLFWACAFGPLFPYQYRLTGCHTWSGARDTVLNATARFRTSLNPKSGLLPSSTSSMFGVFSFAAVVLLGIFLFFLF